MDEKLSENDILALARRYLPDARAITAIFDDGWDHLVYEIDAQSVVKVPRPGTNPDQLAKESFLLRELQEIPQLPVPQVLGFSPGDGATVAHLAMTRAPGISLVGVSLGRFGWPRPAHLVHAVGRAIARLHSLPVERFRASGLLELLDMEMLWGTGLAYLKERGLVTDVQCRALAERFGWGLTRVSSVTSVVLHKDLGAQHCFVDPATRQLTGIIDWADACLGPAAWEFAGYFSSNLEASDWWFKEILAGYTEIQPLPVSFREQINFYRLVKAVSLPFWADPAGGHHLVQNCLAEIARQLEN